MWHIGAKTCENAKFEKNCEKMKKCEICGNLRKNAKIEKYTKKCEKCEKYEK